VKFLIIAKDEKPKEEKNNPYLLKVEKRVLKMKFFEVKLFADAGIKINV
jgi:hypothetical protein